MQQQPTAAIEEPAAPSKKPMFVSANNAIRKPVAQQPEPADEKPEKVEAPAVVAEPEKQNRPPVAATGPGRFRPGQWVKCENSNPLLVR